MIKLYFLLQYILLLSTSQQPNLPVLFNVLSKQWKTIPIILPNSFNSTTFMLSDGRFMGVGGNALYQIPYYDGVIFNHSNVRGINSAFIYNVVDKQWNKIKKMIYNHDACSVVQIKNRVYVVGIVNIINQVIILLLSCNCHVKNIYR